MELGYIIDEKYRRQGYAYEACQGIIQESAKRGAVYLHCRIKSGNKASVNLAEKLGFQKIDYRLEDDGKIWRSGAIPVNGKGRNKRLWRS